MLIQACYKRLLAIVAIVLISGPASHAATALPPTFGGSTGGVQLARIHLKGPTDNITKVANAMSSSPVYRQAVMVFVSMPLAKENSV